MKIFGKTPTFYLYIGINVAAIILAFIVPFSWNMLILLGVSYFFGMFFITAGYHRYFSHRSYRLERIPQFMMAWLCQASAQKGILWWAANHRDHHLHSDEEEDLHSPIQRGFWYSHIGWVFDEKTQGYNANKIKDLSSFPELRFLNKYHWLPTLSWSIVVFLVGGFTAGEGRTFFGSGFTALVWGYGLPLLCMYQASYCINSLAHVYGHRSFETSDHSRNNFWLAILTMGEGWHNNHHYCKSSARQGYKWYEIDMTFYMLTILSWVGIVKDMRPFRVHETKQVVVEAKQPQQEAQPQFVPSPDATAAA